MLPLSSPLSSTLLSKYGEYGEYEEYEEYEEYAGGNLFEKRFPPDPFPKTLCKKSMA